MTVAVIAEIGVAACTGGSSPTTPTNSSPTTATISGPPSSASPSASLTAEQQAAEEAKQAYANYRKTVDRVFQNGGANAREEFGRVAAGTQLPFLLKQADGLQGQHQHQVGSVMIKKVGLRGVALGKGKLPQVSLTVCVDSSQRDVIDSSGRSVLPSDRPSVFLESIILARFGDRGWLVTGEEDTQVKSC